MRRLRKGLWGAEWGRYEIFDLYEFEITKPLNAGSSPCTMKSSKYSIFHFQIIRTLGRQAPVQKCDTLTQIALVSAATCSLRLRNSPTFSALSPLDISWNAGHDGPSLKSWSRKHSERKESGTNPYEQCSCDSFRTGYPLRWQSSRLRHIGLTCAFSNADCALISSCLVFNLGSILTQVDSGP